MHTLVNRRVQRASTATSFVQAGILVALGFCWAAAGLMIMASVVTLVLSAPSLFALIGALLAASMVAKAMIKGAPAAINRHAPPAA
jgi:hypothetical protein